MASTAVSGTDPLAAGRAALRNAAWDEARARFEEAVDAGDGPEAWEGLGRAAWWQGDQEETLAARERAGLGFPAELRLLGSARALNLIACAYATTREEAQTAADAGADLVVAHLGITREGGDNVDPLVRLAAIAEAVQGTDALVLCHGGSLSSPAAVRAALGACPDVVGWFGASAIERLPIERAVRDATAAFKHANRAGLALDGTR